MNKTKLTMCAMLLPIALTGCQSKEASEKIIEKPDINIVDGQFTPEVLEAFGRIGDVAVNPDGKTVALTVSYEDIEENKSNAEIYKMEIGGKEMTRLTKTAKSESNLRWFQEGEKLAYLAYDKNTEAMQIHSMDADGNGVKCLSKVKNGIECFEIAPDGKHVVFASPIDDFNQKDSTLFAGLPKTTGRVVDDLMYKHWDEWVEKIPHPFIAEFNPDGVGEATDIMAGEPFECPMRPFGGAESFAWAPDGKSLIYVSRKLKGQEYAFSTNSNLYQYDLESKQTVNLTAGEQGYNTDPAFSPDGKQVAWLSMATAKYESDKKRLMVMDMATKQVRDLTANWDYWPENIAWSPNGKKIWFSGYYEGTEPVFTIDVATCTIDTVANGICDYGKPQPISDTQALTLRHSMREPNEMYMVGGEEKKLTTVNDELLAKLKLGEVRKVMVPTTDGKMMTCWEILPPDFDPNKKYPAILYCQGGPQQAVSQFWSYRWNFMIMAANGYVVIAPNRRGLPGFGTEWNRQISGDYGGQNMQDYFSATDYIKARPYVDADHVGAIGASYGGFSVYWLAGHNDGRFAALVSHAGIFNIEAQYLETEEMWFADFDLGGPYWDKENAIAQRTYATSPHKFVNNWTAPMLITVGELDYRILASQGMMAFNAAKMHGLEAEMLVFPDENHWILKPQNAILWQRCFFRFLDKYLKK